MLNTLKWNTAVRTVLKCLRTKDIRMLWFTDLHSSGIAPILRASAGWGYRNKIMFCWLFSVSPHISTIRSLYALPLRTVNVKCYPVQILLDISYMLANSWYCDSVPMYQIVYFAQTNQNSTACYLLQRI